MSVSSRLFVITALLGLVFVLAACASAPAATSAPTDAPQTASAPATEAPLAPVLPTETIAAPTAEMAAAGGVSFKNDVLPIFERSCVRCHGGSRREDGLDLRTYASLMSGSEKGAVILPGNANDSELIIQVITGEMPRRAPKLPNEQIQILVDWVNQGALDN
jgi:mono/diheme cytochrome c family protein